MVSPFSGASMTWRPDHVRLMTVSADCSIRICKSERFLKTSRRHHVKPDAWSCIQPGLTRCNQITEVKLNPVLTALEPSPSAGWPSRRGLGRMFTARSGKNFGRCRASSRTAPMRTASWRRPSTSGSCPSNVSNHRQSVFKLTDFRMERFPAESVTLVGSS